MSGHANPFRCDGCHGGDMADFDHYCDVMGVPMEHTPQAFAAWLAGAHDWRGTYRDTPPSAHEPTRENTAAGGEER